jgi:phage terminase large subunit-like protein
VTASIDRVTRDWIRNPSDERAAKNGARFDLERGRFVVDWIERYCKLYEGEWAGQPMKLRDWQLDTTLRLFGWVRHSEKWGRWIRRFRQASIWVAKKNKKTPTIAAWGLYLLCGDGEPGQKVFLAAKDGRQARDLAGKHVVEMLLSSPDLMAECELNRTLLQVTHTSTRSLLVPLSSSNSRTQESKEGLNGSILMDEVHVVDRDFVRRISRAGISRSEPLQIEVSTAGNNPDGYGHERFDLARQVEKAEPGYENDELFVAIHAAPQDVTDEQLEEDLEKYARMANPALGHTVEMAELRRDYEQSKRSIQALLDFKMYRLNVWQKAANPWLKEGDWQSCKRDFTAADLEGRECCAAFDLARTRDLTALVLCFPWPEDDPETHRLLPFFWVPQKRAEELANLGVPVFEWARAKYLEITPGAVTDYGYVKTRFRELAKAYRIRELAYDPKFAEELTQSLSEGTTSPTGQVLEEGTGVPRVLFKQDDASYAAPTEDFERLVLSGKLHHNGHPVLNWQAGHATIIRRQNKVKRVVKPTADDYRTVDGIQAGIMALGRCLSAPAEASVYETRGLATIGTVAESRRDMPEDFDEDDD